MLKIKACSNRKNLCLKGINNFHCETSKVESLKVRQIGISKIETNIQVESEINMEKM